MAYSRSNVPDANNAMKILQRIVKSFLAAGVGAGIVRSLLRYRYLRHQRKLFEELAGVKIQSIRRTLTEDDEYSSAFLGGSYSSSFIATAADASRLLSSTPHWADQGWQDGYQATLASSLRIPVNPHIRSIRGREGNDIYRILTIDTSSNAIYFELREY